MLTVVRWLSSFGLLTRFWDFSFVLIHAKEGENHTASKNIYKSKESSDKTKSHVAKIKPDFKFKQFPLFLSKNREMTKNIKGRL
jgi:hypothetical protein